MKPGACFQPWAGPAKGFETLSESWKISFHDQAVCGKHTWLDLHEGNSLGREASLSRCSLDCFAAHTESLQSLGLYIKPGGQRSPL